MRVREQQEQQELQDNKTIRNIRVQKGKPYEEVRVKVYCILAQSYISEFSARGSEFVFAYFFVQLLASNGQGYRM